MKSVHIRDIEPSVLTGLKRLARSHHRSLQGELRDILSHAARLAPPEEHNAHLDLVTVSTGGVSQWSRDEIYDDGVR